MKAVTKYGKDYEKISTVLKNRSHTQLRSKVFSMIKQVKPKTKHENSKYAKILKKLPIIGPLM